MLVTVASPLLVCSTKKSRQHVDCVLGSVFCVSLGSYCGNISICTVNFYNSLEWELLYSPAPKVLWRWKNFSYQIETWSHSALSALTALAVHWYSATYNLINREMWDLPLQTVTCVVSYVVTYSWPGGLTVINNSSFITEMWLMMIQLLYLSDLTSKVGEQA